ncbi:ZIP family metal transporter, partial [Acinetobacter baumannii]
VLCAWLVGLSALLLPWGLAAAGGAMLFVVTHEIIPESHRQGQAAEATLGLVFGFCLMLVLDTALG